MRRQVVCLLIVLLGTLGINTSARAHTAPPHLRVASAEVAQRLPDPPSGQVALLLAWDFYPWSLPGEFRLYRPAGKTNQLWASESVAKGQHVPLGSEYKDSVIFVTPGEKILVTVVWRNPTSRDIRFYMEPHQVIPTSAQSLGWLTCMCMSIMYGAPPGGTWYRTIGVQIAPETPPRMKLVAVHTVITQPAWLPPMP